MSSNSESKVIVKGTAKVFKYNAGIESVVDGNTVQIPFISEYKGERKTAMEYIWYTKDEKGDLHKRGILVSGHGIHGVPTLFDSDVYVTLQDIFLQKKTVKGQCELQVDNISDDYLIIDFTINELAREMGYSMPISNTTRNNLKKSIETLLSTTIFSLYEGGVYDIRNKKYLTKMKKGYHLLESIDEAEITDELGNIVYDGEKIKLSKYTYEQIVNDYKLFYNKVKYRTPKNRIARKIYHMALQWKGKNDFSYAKIDTLIEKIPMIEQDNRYKKRTIKNALKLLNNSDVIKINIDKKDLVYFDFRSQETIEEYKNKYNKYSEIKEKLFEMGFTLIEVDEILDVEKIRYTQALLRYMDYQKVITPKPYFLKCFNDVIDIDKKFYDEDSLKLT